MRSSGRNSDQLREVSLTPSVNMHAEGSCLAVFGNTRILCTASLEPRVPPWLRKTGLGWITAEYGMLPRATRERTRREAGAVTRAARSVEIQRLIGRSLRVCVDRALLGEREIRIDCDVLQADGGTRCAAITGGYVALRLAMDRLLEDRILTADPMVEQVTAVSCGIVGSVPLLDLDYGEDSDATTDANFVLTSGGDLAEVQATAESRPFTADQLENMLALARKGCAELCVLQDKAVTTTRDG